MRRKGFFNLPGLVEQFAEVRNALTPQQLDRLVDKGFGLVVVAQGIAFTQALHLVVDDVAG